MLLSRALPLGAFVAALLTAPAALAVVDNNPPPPKVPAYIQKGVDSPERVQKQKDRDVGRKPGETLAFAGLKPGQKVVELASFGQYYTDIMAPIVGPKGHIWMYDLPYTDKIFGEPSRAFVAKHPNTEFAEAKFDEMDWPRNVDLITIVLYYHDLQYNGVDTAVLDRMMFEALKPGGKLLIVDHKADAGSGWRDSKTIHRMGVETIVKEVMAAGFKLKVDSDLLANPQDDHHKMVFAPGERGHTDQALFVFEKPRR
ncbi:MAG: class I SAM-dependent methyltransferase [Caulobacteraceae bacterium]